MSPRFLLCAVALIGFGSAFAQSTSPKTASQSAVPPAVAPDDLVIQIAGACESPPGEFAVRDCIRGVTREEFESLVALTNPNATAADRQKLAETVGRLIVLSNEARKRGLPKDPKVHELLRMLQVRELASLLMAQSEKQAAEGITDAEIESFYQAHQADYQTAELVRLTIPRRSTELASPDDAAYAESTRTRCAAGEDPAKLQTEALHRVNREMKPPEELKNQKRTQYKEAEQAMFGLNPGDCAVFADDKNAFHLYKLIAFSAAPLAEVRNAILQRIRSERLKNELDAIAKQSTIHLNNKYFTAPIPPSPATK